MLCLPTREPVEPMRLEVRFHARGLQCGEKRSLVSPSAIREHHGGAACLGLDHTVGYGAREVGEVKDIGCEHKVCCRERCGGEEVQMEWRDVERWRTHGSCLRDKLQRQGVHIGGDSAAAATSRDKRTEARSCAELQSTHMCR